MKLARVVLGLFLIETTAFAAPQQQAARGVIEGVVARAGTGEPVAGAQVSLMVLNVAAAAGAAGGVPGAVVGASTFSVNGVLPESNAVVVSTTAAPPPPPLPSQAQAAPRLPGQIPPATTDSAGKFSFKDLDAGGYRVSVTASGYVRQEYGQRVMNGLGTTVFLTAGQTLGGLSIPMTPTGILSGRILDDAGQPATGVPVQLLQAAYGPNGKTFRVGGSTNVDDRGEYRIFGLTPGRYYLVAGNGPGPSRLPGARGGGPAQAPGVSYALTYFPASAEMTEATLVEVKPGTEFRADMNLKRQQSFRVRGRIIDSRTGLPPQNVQLSLTYRTFNGGGSMGQARNYDPSTGNFDLVDVIPGNWTIQAQIQEQLLQSTVLNAANPLVRQASQAVWPVGLLPIKVTNADLEGLMVVIRTGISIPGRIVVEGQPLSAVPNIGNLRIQFRPSVDGVFDTINTGSNPVALPPGADGEFRVEGVREGEFAVTVPGVAPGFYVKGIRYAGDDVLNKPLRFSGPGTDPLEITLRAGGAQVTGTVNDARSAPARGTQVVLLPDQRNRTELIRNAITDQSGRFSFANVPPGDYKIFSWEALEQNGYFDPDWMKGYESKGRAVRVAESAANTVHNVEVTIIPAE